MKLKIFPIWPFIEKSVPHFNLHHYRSAAEEIKDAVRRSGVK